MTEIKRKNRLRTVVVFMAVVSLLFFIAINWLELDIPQEVLNIAQLVAAVLVALGILVDTGATPQPLSWESILEKLKSPIAVSSLFALLSYIVYLKLAPGEADVIMKTIDTLIIAIFGFSVYNNPNNRNALK